MTAKTFASALRVAALSAVWAVGGLVQAPAQAGLVSGNWDPEFGPALPGLSWAVHAELLVPDNACTDLAGNQSTASGPCAGATVQGVFLRLYDNATVGAPDWSNPASYSSTVPDAAAFAVCDSSVSGNAAYISRCGGNFGNYFSLDALRLEGGSVAGLQATVATIFAGAVNFGAGPQPLPTSGQGHDFSLAFTLNGPQLTCTTCPGGPVQSQLDGLRQFLITYTSDDNAAPKFSDGNGNALGVRLDQNGRVLGLSTSINGALLVPEPGSLGLVAAALVAAALLRRRRV